MKTKPTSVEKFQVWMIRSLSGRDETFTVLTEPYVSYVKGVPHWFVDGFYVPDCSASRIPVERMLMSRAWKFIA